MNKEEHLLVCLSEECAEIIKSISKALRFGFDDHHPNNLTSNYEAIERELNDLYGVIELLSEAGLHFPIDRLQIGAKKEKVKYYMEYAEAKGTIDR